MSRKIYIHTIARLALPMVICLSAGCGSQEAMTGTAAGKAISADGMGSTAGELDPGLDLEKATNGDDADQAPGPTLLEGDPVAWTYVVTNIGDVLISDIVVVDDQGVAVSCPRTELGEGESMICTGSGVATVGQYENIGTATGMAPDQVVVSDEDPSHYFGEALETNPAIDIEKATNGDDADAAPGPVVTEGDAITWTYVVTNIGDVSLSEVTVSDDQGVAVSCPATALDVGESMTCTGSGTATVGQYQNIGTATGMALDETAVTDEDASHYFGEAIETNPAIDIEKATNGDDADAAPGPVVTEGDAITWTYVVTNVGDVSLADVAVSDDQGVAVSCPATALDVGESMTCTGSGVATVGQYENIGTATGMAPDETTVSDEDASHYFGEAVLADQGCSHGFWKNHMGAWAATGYTPDQLVDSVFAEAAAYPDLASATLEGALRLKGGPTAADAAGLLMKQAIAALLNATHPDVPSPRAEVDVIADVDAALFDGDRQEMLQLKDELDVDNNLGCSVVGESEPGGAKPAKSMGQGRGKKRR